MADDSADFYDDLAADYHLIFEDWAAAIDAQAEILDRVIRSAGGGASTLLDCACGIGTQALGLAARGYRVTATDQSPAAVARARREAAVRGLRIDFAVADLRRLGDAVPADFDVVLAADNALAHMIANHDLEAAARQMAAVLRPGGLLVASIRDYDSLPADRPAVMAPRFFDHPGGRRIVHQVWDWRDQRIYDLHLYITTQVATGWHARHYQSRCRALLRSELTELFQQAGFGDGRWLMPDVSGYYQPIFAAARNT